MAAVLAAMRDVGLEGLLFSRPSRERTIAMIAARIVDPRSNLATLAKNRVRVRNPSGDSAHEFYLLTQATGQQQRALDLLRAKP